jgi:hypothetical protein
MLINFRFSVVVLAMKPFKPAVVSPQLTLSIRIHELDVGSVSAQLGNIYLSDIDSPNSDELFQRVLYRLECLTRFTSGIAQVIINQIYSTIHIYLIYCAS